MTAIDTKDTFFELYNLKSENLTTHSDLFSYNPIYLQEKQTGKYRIVDGFLSYQTVLQSKENTIPAFVFNSKMTEFDLWIFRLTKRVVEQNFSLISIIEKLSDLMLENQIIIQESPGLKTLLKKLHISPHLQISQLFNDIIKRKEQIAAITNPASLNFKELLQLSKLEPEVLVQLSLLLGGLALKGNKLSSCLKIIEELKNGFGKSITDILKDDQIQNILETVSDHLKYKAIKQRLSELRFPRLNQMQQKWDQNIKQLKLDQQISLSADPYFEDDYLKIEIQAKSAKQLKKQLEDLLEKVSQGKFKELFDLI